MQSTGTETWKTIPGYEGLYEVSDDGRVKSLPRTDSLGRPAGGRTLSPYRHPAGHLLVHLTNRDRGKAFYIHRLVMDAFVGPCPEGMEVRHLDDDPTNNTLSNLVYGTRTENMFDRVRNGIHPARNKTHCPRGHVLDNPNLVACMAAKGFRTCLACSRARAWCRTHPKDDLQAVSDDRYRQIQGVSV